MKISNEIEQKSLTNSIGDRVRFAITELNYKNPPDFAKKNSISRSTLYALIDGKIKRPSPEILDIMKNHLINLNWLLTGEGEMFVAKKEDDAAAREKSNEEKELAGGAEVLKVDLGEGYQPHLKRHEFFKEFYNFIGKCKQGDIDLMLEVLYRLKKSFGQAEP